MTEISSRDGRSFGNRLASGLAVGALLVMLPAVAMAQDGIPQGGAPGVVQEPTAVPSKFQRTVGGHIGFATPVVSVADETTTIADQFTILNPIGITLKVSEKLAVDFEVVVATHIDQMGKTTGLVIDPGVVYNWGPVATGLRVAWQIQSTPNIGLIPLVNRGIVNFGEATWFVEAAFPTFYMNDRVNFDLVLHTGVGF